MKLINLFAVLALTIMSIQGCAATAVQEKLIPTGGSRADGVVKLSYEYDSKNETHAFPPDLIPKADKIQGWKAAKQRCEAWGYTDAEAGRYTTNCINWGSYGCNRWLVNVDYQCTGVPPASR